MGNVAWKGRANEARRVLASNEDEIIWTRLLPFDLG